MQSFFFCWLILNMPLQRHVSHEPAARVCTYQSPAPRRHSEQVADLVCVMCIPWVCCYVCACGRMPRLTCFLTPQPVVATGAGLKAARPLRPRAESPHLSTKWSVKCEARREKWWPWAAHQQAAGHSQLAIRNTLLATQLVRSCCGCLLCA